MSGNLSDETLLEKSQLISPYLVIYFC